jgi:adenosylcobinamide kinase / adenosylcobinamide-phosphate guanylyltransferase
MKHFILGGARSGKSRYAEKTATDSGLPVLYIATAQVYDDEFAQRIAHHRERRPADWGLIEEPFFLAETIRREARADRFLLIDCLTLYLAQWLCADCRPPQHRSWNDERAELLEVVANAPGSIALVSNEVGLGIVPLGEINRCYQDEAGWLNQHIAAICDRAVFMAAGLPLQLKNSV